ncbi:porin family protein [Candidatus Bandiella numerosa]|uniref:outer membrane protein n=1 Tax=Candidatus Bandiella numerosa TaxID=2570586 RepID=UPI00249F6699|nr:outer membrane protein [Candidatus Bandiella numerosa]WHA05411.1 porin family protein [Candidatus Bandiella numerosa]
MKKYTLGIISALLTTSNALAKDNNYYIKAEVGVAKSQKIKSKQQFYGTDSNKGFNSSPIYSLGFGYKINDKFRTEITYNYTDFKYKRNTTNVIDMISEYKQKVNIQTGMVNLFYDVATYQKLTPYLGVGVGYAKINPNKASLSTKDIETLYISNKSENLTYALMAGVSIAMTDRINFDIGYKFQDFGKAKGFNKYEIPSGEVLSTDPEKFSIRAHIATIGVRYSF